MMSHNNKMTSNASLLCIYFLQVARLLEGCLDFEKSTRLDTLKVQNIIASGFPKI